MTAALVVLAAAPAHADRAITGVIVDDTTGAPVVGAIVVAGEQEAITDANGAFTLADVPFGRIDLIVVADGFSAYFGSARIGAALTIRLASEARSGGEVIQVAGRAPSGPPLHLSTEEIRALPGAGNDALKRGAEPARRRAHPVRARRPRAARHRPRDTNVYLDGIEVPLSLSLRRASRRSTDRDGRRASAVSPAARATRTAAASAASSPSRRGPGATIAGAPAASSASSTPPRRRGPGPADGAWLVGVRRSYFDGIVAAVDLDVAGAALRRRASCAGSPATAGGWRSRSRPTTRSGCSATRTTPTPAGSTAATSRASRTSRGSRGSGCATARCTTRLRSW